MKTPDLTTFFSDGYVSSSLVDCASTTQYSSYDISCFDEFECTDVLNEDKDLSFSPKAQLLLDDLHQYFAENWIGAIFSDYEIKDNAMWAGVDEGSAIWHNDFEDGDSFNSNICVYLDNTDDKGNKLEVMVGERITTLYPQRSDFVWLNQKSCFQHKASHTSGPRRLLSFEFMIPDLL